MDPEEKRIVILTGFSHALSHGFMLIFPAVLLLLQKEFSLGYLELGMIGNLMTFTYGLGALPGGLIYNRIGPKRLYLLCFLGSSLVSLMIAASSTLILFTVGMAFLGALGSVYHPLANSLITGKVRRYGQALGIHGALGNVGLATAPFLAGFIASYQGWRYAYLWFALPSMALSIWAFFIDMSSKEEVKNFIPSPPGSSIPARFFKNYFSLPLVWLYLLNMFNAFCFYGSVTFLPAYMAKRTSFHIFSLDPLALGGMLSGTVLIMGVFGQFFGGILAQKPQVEKKLLIFSLLSFPFILSLSFTTNFLLLFLALVYYFFNFSLQPMNNTLLAQYTHPGMRGTAFGIYFSISFGVGSLASTYSGYIAEKFGLEWLFAGLSGSALLLIVFAFILQKIKKTRY